VELQPGLPASLNQIILTAIAKNPAERFQSAEAFRNAVGQVGQQLPTLVVPSTMPVPTPVARVAPVAKAEPVAQAPPPPPRQAGRRGLYITLGALIVLGVLVAAGLYVPGRGKASEPIATPPPDPPPAVAPEPPVQVTEEAKPDRQAEERRRRLLMELEQQVDQLSSRAAAVNASLDRLQQQPAAAGYSLRGDMVARQATMRSNLARAQRAVEQGDPAKAKRYVEQADNDVEALEHFLGR
jgi:eukaryotic-like serine/threonine-protein kinase